MKSLWSVGFIDTVRFRQRRLITSLNVRHDRTPASKHLSDGVHTDELSFGCRDSRLSLDLLHIRPKCCLSRLAAAPLAILGRW